MKSLVIILLLISGVFIGGAMFLSFAPVEKNQTEITKEISLENIQ
jgi:hypothetical protein